MTSGEARNSKEGWTILLKRIAGQSDTAVAIIPSAYVKSLEYPIDEVGNRVVDCVRAFVNYTRSAEWASSSKSCVSGGDLIWVGGAMFNDDKSRLYVLASDLAAVQLDDETAKAFELHHSIGH